MVGPHKKLFLKKLINSKIDGLKYFWLFQKILNWDFLYAANNYRFFDKTIMSGRVVKSLQLILSDSLQNQTLKNLYFEHSMWNSIKTLNWYAKPERNFICGKISSLKSSFGTCYALICSLIMYRMCNLENNLIKNHFKTFSNPSTLKTKQIKYEREREEYFAKYLTIKRCEKEKSFTTSHKVFFFETILTLMFKKHTFI